MTMNPEQLQRIFEAAIMVAGRPLTVADLQKLFDEPEQPSTQEIRSLLQAMQQQYSDRGIELREVASGYQFQAKMDLSPWLGRLWDERAPRYSRAVLETIALIAYRQPITRAEIEEIRGVAVSTHITKTLLEREWIRVIGHKDVPGKPALYGTTKALLDHLNLKSLTELPTLAELSNMESQEEKLQIQLELASTEANDEFIDEFIEATEEETLNLSEEPNTEQSSQPDEQVETSTELT
ncbi:MAG: SMC-Scp complex subunit ScpB [Gammaproteobacteria bacterium]|nr:SMC-Scp complex subunit ScpB [Gammaproteobacteria bacterium]